MKNFRYFFHYQLPQKAKQTKKKKQILSQLNLRHCNRKSEDAYEVLAFTKSIELDDMLKFTLNV